MHAQLPSPSSFDHAPKNLRALSGAHGFARALFVAALTAATVASAEIKKGGVPDVEIFLEVPGILGDVSVEGFKNQIAISAFSWRASNSLTPGSGGGLGSGKVTLDNLALTKFFDSTSPELFHRTVTGQVAPEATLRVVRTAGGVRKDYIKIKMEDVIITSMQLGQAAGIGENAVSEVVTIAFSKVKITHTGLDGTVTEKSWSVAGSIANVAGGAKQSATFLAVPDVCKTPSPGGPVPIPYPNTRS